MTQLDAAKAAMEDQEFVGRLLTMEAPENVQNAFREKGVDLSLDDVKRIGNAVFADGGEEELSNENLEAVSGGITIEAVTVIVSGITIILKIGTFIRKNYGW